MIDFYPPSGGKERAKIRWRSISTLPGHIVIGIAGNKKLSFDKFAEENRDLPIERGQQLTLAFENLDNGKRFPFTLDLDLHWFAPKTPGGTRSALRDLDISDAIKAIL